jgi:hypothetical protein
MSFNDYFIEAAAQNIGNNTYIVNKFGHNAAVGTTPVPISHGGIYRTPQVSGATTVRVKAGDADDASDGTGARSIYIEGINASGEKVSEVIPTNGETAGANSSNSYIRLYRAYVNESGTYGSQSSSSHAADIVIENSAGTADWITIDLDSAGFADSQSEVGAFTVPRGKTAYILNITYAVDSTKQTSLFLYKRNNILDTSAPYSSVRKQFGIFAAKSTGTFDLKVPIKIEELTDIGFLASVDSNTAGVSIYFSVLIRDNE